MITYTATIAGEVFVFDTVRARALQAALTSGRVPAMLLGCTRCRIICSGGYDTAPLNIPCPCCVEYAQMQRKPPSGRGRPKGSDLGAHLRAPIDDVITTITRAASRADKEPSHA